MEENNQDNDPQDQSWAMGSHPEEVSFYRGKLGEMLHQDTPNFNLSDPNLRALDCSYNPLHDKHLQRYYRHPKRKRQLVKKGFITSDEKVLCTLREYTCYDNYLKTVQLEWEKEHYKEQKCFLKQFLILKEENAVPSNIAVEDMREWLILKGRRAFKMYQRESMDDSSICKARLSWEVRHRLKMEELEKEVKREMRLERSISWCPNEQTPTFQTQKAVSMEVPKRSISPGVVQPYRPPPHVTDLKRSSFPEGPGSPQPIRAASVLTVRELLRIVGTIKSFVEEAVGDNLIPVMAEFVEQTKRTSSGSLFPISKLSSPGPINVISRADNDDVVSDSPTYQGSTSSLDTSLFFDQDISTYASSYSSSSHGIDSPTSLSFDEVIPKVTYKLVTSSSSPSSRSNQGSKSRFTPLVSSQKNVVIVIPCGQDTKINNETSSTSDQEHIDSGSFSQASDMSSSLSLSNEKPKTFFYLTSLETRDSTDLLPSEISDSQGDLQCPATVSFEVSEPLPVSSNSPVQELQHATEVSSASLGPVPEGKTGIATLASDNVFLPYISETAKEVELNVILKSEAVRATESVISMEEASTFTTKDSTAFTKETTPTTKACTKTSATSTKTDIMSTKDSTTSRDNSHTPTSESSTKKSDSPMNVPPALSSDSPGQFSPTRLFISRSKSSPIGEDLVDGTLVGVIAALRMDGFLPSSEMSEEELGNFSPNRSSASSPDVSCVSIGPFRSESETPSKLLGGDPQVMTPECSDIWESIELYGNEIIDAILLKVATQLRTDSASDLSEDDAFTLIDLMMADQQVVTSPPSSAQSRISSQDRRFLCSTFMEIRDELSSNDHLLPDRSISPQVRVKALEMIELMYRHVKGSISEPSIPTGRLSAEHRSYCSEPRAASGYDDRSCGELRDGLLRTEKVKRVFESLSSRFLCSSIKPVVEIIERAKSQLSLSSSSSLEQSSSSTVAQAMVESALLKLAEMSCCTTELDPLDSPMRCCVSLASALSSHRLETNTLPASVLGIKKEMGKELVSKLKSFLGQEAIVGQSAPLISHRATSSPDLREAVRDILKKTKDEEVNRDQCGVSPVQSDEHLSDTIVDVLYPKFQSKIQAEREIQDNRTFSMSQVSCSTSCYEVENNLDLQDFRDPLSESVMTMLEKTFGKRAKSLKTEQNIFQQVIDPTFEKLLIAPHANGKDMVVQKVSVEELSSEHTLNNLTLDTFRNSSPSVRLLEGVVGKLALKMLIQSLDIPEHPTSEEPTEELVQLNELVAQLCPLLTKTIMGKLLPTTAEDKSTTIETPVQTREKSLEIRKDSPLRDCQTCKQDPPLHAIDDKNPTVMDALDEKECGRSVSPVDSKSLHSTPDVVMDLITKLFQGVDTDTEDEASHETSPAPLPADVAMGMVVSVTQDMSGKTQMNTALETTKELHVVYSRPSSVRIESSQRKEQEECMDSPPALRRSLNPGSNVVTDAVTTAVARDVTELIHRHAPSPSFASKKTQHPAPDLPSGRSLSSNICLKTKYDGEVLSRSPPASAELKTTEPVTTVVHVDTVKDIFGRLLTHILPMTKVKLDDWMHLVDDTINKLSDTLWVRVTKKWSKATACLGATEIFQVVLFVHDKLVHRCGTEATLKGMLLDKEPNLCEDIVHYVVKGIVKSQAKELNNQMAVCQSPSAQKQEFNIGYLDDLVLYVFKRINPDLGHENLNRKVLSRTDINLLTLEIIDRSIDQLKTDPEVTMVDRDDNSLVSTLDLMASNIHKTMLWKAGSQDAIQKALMKRSLWVLQALPKELIKEIKTHLHLRQSLDEKEEVFTVPRSKTEKSTTKTGEQTAHLDSKVSDIELVSGKTRVVNGEMGLCSALSKYNVISIGQQPKNFDSTEDSIAQNDKKPLRVKRGFLRRALKAMRGCFTCRCFSKRADHQDH